jgi:hypothetical protein
LLPAYYQAVIAQVQLGQVKSPEFRKALAELDAHFNGGNYGTGLASYGDGYRWMYWARVYELLVRLKHDEKFKDFFDADKLPSPPLEKALRETYVRLNSVLGDHHRTDLSASVTLGNIGPDYNPARLTMLAIALESIWESVELPTHKSGQK